MKKTILFLIIIFCCCNNVFSKEFRYEVITDIQNDYYYDSLLQYPKFNSKYLKGSKNLNKLINNTLKEKYSEFKENALLYCEQFKESDDFSFYPSSFDVTMSVFHDEKYTSVVLLFYYYYLGSAHGNSVYKTFVFNNQSKQIENDIYEISGLSRERITDLCIQSLDFEYSEERRMIDGLFFMGPDEDDQFKNFVIDKNRLIIYFNPYEVGPYSMGTPEVVIFLNE